MRIAEWKEGEEPMLEVNKRGRFITNMGFANFVTAAVDSDDPRIKGSCLVILEEDDPGLFDRGTPDPQARAPAFLHQRSGLQPARPGLPHRRRLHRQGRHDRPELLPQRVIEAVFRRTRITVGLMTSAKLLSAIEPLIRYHRDRFRGGGSVPPGSPRYELGLQKKEDVLHRLIDVWAAGEAGASLGFATARLFDELDPIEKAKDKLLAEQGIRGGMAAFKALRKKQKDAVEFVELSARAAVTAARSKHSPPIRWCSSWSWTRWRTSCAPPPSSGTPATART